MGCRIGVGIRVLEYTQNVWSVHHPSRRPTCEGRRNDIVIDLFFPNTIKSRLNLTISEYWTYQYLSKISVHLDSYSCSKTFINNDKLKFKA